jgi:hypothetical protein
METEGKDKNCSSCYGYQDGIEQRCRYTITDQCRGEIDEKHFEQHFREPIYIGTRGDKRRDEILAFGCTPDEEKDEGRNQLHKSLFSKVGQIELG